MDRRPVLSILETLPTYYGVYGQDSIKEPVSAGDVAGLIEARRLAAEAEWTSPWGGPERIAVAAMDAALLLLGIDPDAERVPLSQGATRKEAAA